MRKRMTRQVALIAIIVTLMPTLLFSQARRAATFSPRQPKVGDNIAVVYNAGARTATLPGAKAVTLNALLIRDGSTPNLVELPLRKSGKTWKGSFVFDDTAARIVLFKFVSGEMTDDNDGDCWDLLACGKDGKPVEGAYQWRGLMIMFGGGYGFKKTKDMDTALACLNLETTLYPENTSAYAAAWSAQLRATPGEETKARIGREAVDVYERLKDKSNSAGPILSMMERIGQKDLADSLRIGIIASNPKGKVAEATRLNALYGEKDPAKKEDLLKAFLAEFPKAPGEMQSLANSVKRNQVYAALQAREYEQAAAAIESMSPPDGDLYNSLAWSIIEKGEKGPDLDKATGWARRGIELMKEDQTPKPSYQSEADWKKNKAFNLGMIMDTYAFGLFKSGKAAEAERAYEEAVTMTDWGQEEINTRYLDACIANGDYEKALAVGTRLVLKGTSTDKVVEELRTAYTKVKGSDKGFDELLTNARNESMKEARKSILKERVNRRAVSFTVKDIDGKTVRLSDLKGKVVVVDFWATWCGPCRASFPFLQKVYEKYKDNPSVRILAFNTGENETGTQREELVRKFMAENKYTFPVVYDEGYVDRYGVEGIPTKFIIDKNGKVQFKSVGFLNGQKMVDEMTLEIDLLLGDEFYSMK